MLNVIKLNILCFLLRYLFVCGNSRLSKFDVVTTTYGIVGSEGAAFIPPLSGVKVITNLCTCIIITVQ